MRTLKPVLLSIVVVFLVIVVVQNLEVFLDKKALHIDLWMWQYDTRLVPLAVYFLGFFMIGLLVSYVYSIGERFRTKKTLDSYSETVHQLQYELNALKNQSSNDQSQSASEQNSGA
jgi:uncharacterized integral membrane protein